MGICFCFGALGVRFLLFEQILGWDIDVNFIKKKFYLIIYKAKSGILHLLELSIKRCSPFIVTRKCASKILSRYNRYKIGKYCYDSWVTLHVFISRGKNYSLSRSFNFHFWYGSTTNMWKLWTARTFLELNGLTNRIENPKEKGIGIGTKTEQNVRSSSNRPQGS